MNKIRSFLLGGLISFLMVENLKANSAFDRLTDNGLSHRTAEQAAKADDKLWQAREDFVQAYCKSLIGTVSADSPVAVLDQVRKDLNKKIDELCTKLIEEKAAPTRVAKAAFYYVYSVEVLRKLLQKYQ